MSNKRNWRADRASPPKTCSCSSLLHSLHHLFVSFSIVQVVYKMPKARKSKRPRNTEVEDVFSVEKIVDKKVDGGRVFYYLKWRGYDESDNTWEPEENLDCPDLIKEYERVNANSESGVQSSQKSASPSATQSQSNGKPVSAKKKAKTTGKSSNLKVNPKVSVPDKEDELKGGVKGDAIALPDIKTGFARGLEAETILGATEEGGQIMFLIKWLASDKETITMWSW